MKSYTKHMKRAEHYCADAAGTLEIIEMLLEEGPEKWSDPALWAQQLQTHLHFAKVYANLSNKEAKKAARSVGGAFEQKHGEVLWSRHSSWDNMGVSMNATIAARKAKEHADQAERLIKEKMLPSILKDPRSAMSVGQVMADQIHENMKDSRRNYKPNPLLMPKDFKK